MDDELELKKLRTNMASTISYVDQLESYLLENVERIKYLIPAIEHSEVDEKDLSNDDHNVLSALMAYGFAKIVIKQANTILNIVDDDNYV